MTGEVFLAAHSLGAAEVALYALSRVKRGLPVDGLYLFACPRPGDAAVRAGLRPVPLIRSIKNIGDGVTDVPIDAHVKECGLAYCDAMPFEHIHQTPSFIDFLTDPFFAHHHIFHYQKGVHANLPAEGGAVGVNEAVDEVARLYETTEGWDWINPVNGLYWACRHFHNGARLMIRRGSKTGKDWLTQDFNFAQTEMYGARVSLGFWSGVGPIEAQLDAVLA